LPQDFADSHTKSLKLVQTIQVLALANPDYLDLGITFIQRLADRALSELDDDARCFLRRSDPERRAHLSLLPKRAARPPCRPATASTRPDEG